MNLATFSHACQGFGALRAGPVPEDGACRRPCTHLGRAGWDSSGGGGRGGGRHAEGDLGSQRGPSLPDTRAGPGPGSRRRDRQPGLGRGRGMGSGGGERPQSRAHIIPKGPGAGRGQGERLRPAPGCSRPGSAPPPPHSRRAAGMRGGWAGAGPSAGLRAAAWRSTCPGRPTAVSPRRCEAGAGAGRGPEHPPHPHAPAGATPAGIGSAHVSFSALGSFVAPRGTCIGRGDTGHEPEASARNKPALRSFTESPLLCQASAGTVLDLHGGPRGGTHCHLHFCRRDRCGTGWLNKGPKVTVIKRPQRPQHPRCVKSRDHIRWGN